MPTTAKKRTAAQLGSAKESRKKEAEKRVADVVARIGKHLVMEADGSLAGRGTPTVTARAARTTPEPTIGSGGSMAPTKKPVGRPMKKPKSRF